MNRIIPIVIVLCFVAIGSLHAQFIFSFDTLEFGKVPLGNTLTIADTVTNASPNSVYVGSLRDLGPSQAIHLSTKLTSPVFLPPGRQLTFFVQFQPTKIGTELDTIVVSQFQNGSGEEMIARGEGIDSAHSQMVGTIPVSASSLSIFPNPVRSNARVCFTSPTEATVTLSIVDLMGKVSKTIFRGAPNTSGRQAISLQFSNKPPGVYLLVLQKEGSIETTRFVVER